MKRIVGLFTGLAMVLALGVAMTAPVQAINPVKTGCEGNSSSPICQETQNANKKTNDFIQNIVSVLLMVLGIICVIVIIIGGIRYTTSGGDSGQVAAAKNTILYAVVGLIVAILAYAIVNFVLNALKK